jgi:hypothetical protein
MPAIETRYVRPNAAAFTAKQATDVHAYMEGEIDKNSADGFHVAGIFPNGVVVMQREKAEPQTGDSLQKPANGAIHGYQPTHGFHDGATPPTGGSGLSGPVAAKPGREQKGRNLRILDK